MLFRLNVEVADGHRTVRPLPDSLYFTVRDLEAVFDRARDLACLAERDVHGAPAPVQPRLGDTSADP